MSIPGFTAEYSVAAGYPVASHGRARRRSANMRSGVYPALPIDPNQHACYNLCRGGAAYPGCLDECNAALGDSTGGGGGGGGGGGTGPDLHCTKCIRGRHHCVLPGVGGGWFSCSGDD